MGGWVIEQQNTTVCAILRKIRNILAVFFLHVNLFFLSVTSVDILRKGHI